MRKNNMLTGSPIKTIVLFSLPIMLSSLLQYNYSLVDNIIVGRYVSTDALAAVGNVGPIGSFLIGAAFGLTSGFTSLLRTHSVQATNASCRTMPATASQFQQFSALRLLLLLIF